MGRFSEEKRPEMFVDIAHALSRNEGINFLMLGNGPEYDQVKQYIARLNLEERIYAPGFVDDMKPFLKLTDVLVIPSRIEGIPIILMESLAMGVPVVASNIGGIPSVLKDYETGFLCDQGRLEDFVQSLERLYEDRGLYARLKLNARAYAAEELSVHKMNDEYRDAFNSLGVRAQQRSARRAIA
jgi:glycosyltransferase involved in cell wall biosynthesis